MDNNTKISSIIKSLVGTAGIFVFGMMFSFTFNWAITKFMNKADVGFFQYYVSIITFAMVIVPLGYQSLAQREVVDLGRNGLRKLSSQAIIAVSLASLIFGSFWYFGLTEFSWVKDLHNYDGLMIALLIIPIYSLNIYYRAVLQGQNKIYSSVLPDTLIRPIVLLLSLAILPILELPITPTSLLCVLLFILTGSLLFSILKSFQGVQKHKVITSDKWLKQALYLLPIGLLSIINERVDIIMVSKVLGPEANAVYGVAFKFALFSGFGLVILNQVMVPQYAEHFKLNGDKATLIKKIKPNVRLSFLLSLCVLIVLLVTGKYLLGWFGKPVDNYEAGYWSIIILGAGQLFNVAVGSTGYILTMAKKESLVLISIVCGTIVNIILNYILLPIYGIEGAAIATSTSMVVWNVLMLIFVKRKTGINPTII